MQYRMKFRAKARRRKKKRIPAIYRVQGTITGRLSSAEPDFQWPRK